MAEVIVQRSTEGGSRLLLRKLREVMSEPLSAQARLDKTVVMIAASMQAEVSSVYVLRADGQLELFATEGLNQNSVHLIQMRVGQGLVGTVARDGEALNLSQAREHPSFLYFPDIGEDVYTSFLGVPILRAGDTLGVLVVQSRDERHFTDDDVEALQTVALVLAGLWLQLDLAMEGEKPVGVKKAIMAPVLNVEGKSVAGKWRGDAESLTLRAGDALVGFEGTDEILRYPLRADGLKATPQRIPLPADLKDLRSSKGLESLSVFPSASRHAGALFAIGEAPVKGEENLRAWIMDGNNFRRLTILSRDGYMATDVAFLDNGDALLLERKVTPPFGLSSRIRRIPENQLVSGVRADGSTIFEADLSAMIDNMEGIALHKGADGATYITLISDDNFSILQRTLLLRFKLVE